MAGRRRKLKGDGTRGLGGAPEVAGSRGQGVTRKWCSGRRHGGGRGTGSGGGGAGGGGSEGRGAFPPRTGPFFPFGGFILRGARAFLDLFGSFRFYGPSSPPTGTDTGTDTGTRPDDPFRPRDHKWRLGFSASCLTLGSLIVAAGVLFPLRSVRRVTLLRGGREVTISTHGPLGLGRGGPTFTLPLSHVSCGAHRSQVPAALPLKVKGRPFFFLLDKGGHICNPRLFDLTVGAYRKL